MKEFSKFVSVHTHAFMNSKNDSSKVILELAIPNDTTNREVKIYKSIVLGTYYSIQANYIP